MEGVPRSGAGGDLGVGQAEGNQRAGRQIELPGPDLVGAQVGAEDEAAGRVELEVVRVRRLLALLVGAIPGHREDVGRRAERAIWQDRQHDEIGPDVVVDQQVAPGRIDDRAGWDRAGGWSLSLLRQPVVGLMA
jgi:hypothetical protein